MDKWTLVGVVVTALGAIFAFWLVKGLLGFIIDNWVWVLVAIGALLVVGLVATLKDERRHKRDL